jgi:hypothetical protein
MKRMGRGRGSRKGGKCESEIEKNRWEMPGGSRNTKEIEKERVWARRYKYE